MLDQREHGPDAFLAIDLLAHDDQPTALSDKRAQAWSRRASDSAISVAPSCPNGSAFPNADCNTGDSNAASSSTPAFIRLYGDDIPCRQSSAGLSPTCYLGISDSRADRRTNRCTASSGPWDTRTYARLNL